MINRVVPVACLLLVIPALAQAEDQPTIWQTLQRGDTPLAVSEKLQRLSEVKSAKVRGKPGSETVAVSYAGPGIDILGEPFRVVPQFEGGALKRVGLGAQAVCVGDFYVRYTRLIEALKAKYPEEIVGGREELDFAKAKLDATGARPVTVPTVLSDGRTVAFVTHKFTRTDPPPATPYGASNLMRAAANLMWSQYNKTAEQCDGDGVHRVQTIIAYMTREDFNSEIANSAAEDDAAVTSATGKL